MKILLILLLVLTKTFLLGNYVIHVSVSENYPLVQNIENSTVGIKIFLNAQNFTIMPQNITKFLGIYNMSNSSYEILIPYYVVGNQTFTIIYQGNYYANITIFFTVVRENSNNIGINLSNDSTSSSSSTLSLPLNSESVIAIVSIMALTLYITLQRKAKNIKKNK
ncbi:hypothetical protein V6M85_01860 [Sulfolobus tengchongensis]|uniref:Uncharacterized protein n=1 Tax=Sulfolobus tengchongensis TaxID=207809 RepID=A0AAX4L1P8_9CREN